MSTVEVHPHTLELLLAEKELRDTKSPFPAPNRGNPCSNFYGKGGGGSSARSPEDVARMLTADKARKKRKRLATAQRKELRELSIVSGTQRRKDVQKPGPCITITNHQQVEEAVPMTDQTVASKETRGIAQEDPSLDARTVELINETRAKYGLEPLAVSLELVQANKAERSAMRSLMANRKEAA